MVADLKATVVNMKTLTQHIDDPVVVNAADADGRRLRIVFTQEAAAQLAPHTKVYLSWHHQQNNIKGYNVFTELPRDDKKKPPAWEICFPQSMLYCGDVLACIELVDDISIAASTNFMIHVLEDPNDGVPYIFSDDYSEFKLAVISLNSLADEVRDQMAEYATEWENMQIQHEYIMTIVEEIHILNEEMQDTLQDIQARVDEILQECVDYIQDIGQTEIDMVADWLDNADGILSHYVDLITYFEDRLIAAESHAAEALEKASIVGELPITTTATTVIEYINEKVGEGMVWHTFS